MTAPGSASSTQPAVRLAGIGKAYRVYRRPLDRVREVLLRRPCHQALWALQGVDLELAPGETFGLVGENGAGKSTLLKLVAGTLRPSVGEMSVRGQVAALLELGAGFHPEESGRENVMLMGALNGVEPRAMAAYYDQVAEFSELPPDVLARPVKTYSSGMFMRLAFAAATAVEPDILVIDEALSVGDMHFQKKSLDRIMHFRETGRTVLFCSHNLYQLRSLCSRAAWIHDGRVAALGDTEEVVTAYEGHERAKTAKRRSLTAQAEPALPAAPAAPSPGGAPVRLVALTIETPDGVGPAIVETFQPVRLIIDVENVQDVPFHVGFAITRNDKENLFGSATHFVRPQAPLAGPGPHRVAIRFPAFPLLSGDYLLSVYVLDDTGLQVFDMAEQVSPFRVLHAGREFGIVHLPHEWEFPP